MTTYQNVINPTNTVSFRSVPLTRSMSDDNQQVSVSLCAPSTYADVVVGRPKRPGNGIRWFLSMMEDRFGCYPMDRSGDYIVKFLISGVVVFITKEDTFFHIEFQVEKTGQYIEKVLLRKQASKGTSQKIIDTISEVLNEISPKVPKSYKNDDNIRNKHFLSKTSLKSILN